MKNNIEFYDHVVTADQHPKFAMLRVRFGWAGEGRFWALHNRIGQADGCVLDISKKYNKASIADSLGLTMDEFDEYIEYLIEECELIFEAEPGKITTQKIQEVYRKVMSVRESSRNRKKQSSKNTPPPKFGSSGNSKSSGGNPNSSAGKRDGSDEKPESSDTHTQQTQKSSVGKPESSVGSSKSSKRFGRTEQQSRVEKRRVEKTNKIIPLTQPPKEQPAPQPSPDDETPSGAFSKKKKIPVFNKNGGADCEAYFKGINKACNVVESFPPKKKKFNPQAWAQLAINDGAHPGAVQETLEGLSLFWDTADDPWGVCNSILATKNGNWNEKDAIAIHKRLKRMDPTNLEFFTQGLFQAQAIS